MTTSKHDYTQSTTRDLREQLKTRKLTIPRNSTKDQMQGLLEADDAARAKKTAGAPDARSAAAEAPVAPPADVSEFGDMLDTSEAPDAYEPPPPPPSTAVAPKVKIPPDPIEITDENRPPEPKRFKLTNDIQVPQGGLPVRMLAGKILTSDEYNLDDVRKAGGVLVPARVFEKK